MTATTEDRWTAQGFTDDVTECEHCGRVELKGTVRMVTENGAELYAGTTCAARLTGKTARDIRQEARAAQRQQEARQEVAQVDARTRAHYETLSVEYLTEIAGRCRRDAARRPYSARLLTIAESVLSAEARPVTTSRGGRPSIDPSQPGPTKQFHLRIPADLVDRLDAHAEATGTTRSELLRRGAERILENTMTTAQTTLADQIANMTGDPNTAHDLIEQLTQAARRQAMDDLLIDLYDADELTDDAVEFAVANNGCSDPRR